MQAYAGVDRWHMKLMEDADHFGEVSDAIEDSMKWASEALVNFRYNYEHRLQKAKSYLEDAIETINNELERMEE